jgi:hypothetical protein
MEDSRWCSSLGRLKVAGVLWFGLVMPGVVQADDWPQWMGDRTANGTFASISPVANS